MSPETPKTIEEEEESRLRHGKANNAFLTHPSRQLSADLPPYEPPEWWANYPENVLKTRELERWKRTPLGKFTGFVMFAAGWLIVVVFAGLCLWALDHYYLSYRHVLGRGRNAADNHFGGKENDMAGIWSWFLIEHY